MAATDLAPEQGNTETPAPDVTPDAGAEVTPEGGAPATEPVAPESYEAFVMPEGVAMNEEVLTEYQAAAKDMGLSQDNAQKLVDIASKAMGQGDESLVAKQAEAWGQVREGWVEEIKNDKEFGGDNFDVTLERANRALRNYSSEGMIKFLSETGYGDNPELIKMLAKIDKSLGEDAPVKGEEAGGGKSAAEVLFPGLN